MLLLIGGEIGLTGWEWMECGECWEVALLMKEVDESEQKL